MSSVNSASLQPDVLRASYDLAAMPQGSTVAGGVDTRLNALLATTQDPAATPVQKAQALAEADAISGGRVESTFTPDAKSYQLAAQPTTAARAKAKTAGTKIGKDDWTERRSGIVGQLTTESQLQKGGSPGYSRDLQSSANKMRTDSTSFAPGTYRTATPPAVVASGTRVANPLQVDTISASNAQKTVQNQNASIKSNDTIIARLRQDNTRLNQENAKLSGESAKLWGIDPRVAINDAIILKNNSVILKNKAEIKTRDAQNIVTAFQRNKTINDARLQASNGENGKMYQAVATNADARKTPVIFINGVNTDKYRSSMEAMEISRTLGVPVNHIVNVSSMDKLIRGGAGIGVDNALWKSTDPNVTDQRVQQLLTGNNEAAATTANAILDQLNTTSGKVKIIGYSQGAAIGAEALRKVNDIMKYQGVSEADRTKQLSRIEFVGIGPGCAERHISQVYQSTTLGAEVRVVKELKAVNYKTISDARDPIAKLLNVSTESGGRTSGADLGKSKEAIEQLASGGILPHLSYFTSYKATDPGSNYNPQATQALHLWFAGVGERNAIIHGTDAK